MRTGYCGTFVISWAQTDIDGLKTPHLRSLHTGATWSWAGEAVRVDGPNEVLRLDMADAEKDIRKRAARIVRRIVGAALEHKTQIEEVEVDDPLMDGSFVITDGRNTYTATIIETGDGVQPLLMFLDELPPRGVEMWVVQYQPANRHTVPNEPTSGGVICFTPGTRIQTPQGLRRVEDLCEGDKVLTKDNGPQEVCWTGARRMTGARLYAMPQLRPVRIRAGAFGIERPDDEFLVSPEHRMLVKGPIARALFNTPEVLVAARDLVNGTTIAQDVQLREVTYVHLLLPSHQVIWANGVETESFHPANAALSALTDADRAKLLQGFPHLAEDRHAYGAYARRNLSRPEAAILMHEAA
jgi:hypothetical protein